MSIHPDVENSPFIIPVEYPEQAKKLLQRHQKGGIVFHVPRPEMDDSSHGNVDDAQLTVYYRHKVRSTLFEENRVLYRSYDFTYRNGVFELPDGYYSSDLFTLLGAIENVPDLVQKAEVVADFLNHLYMDPAFQARVDSDTFWTSRCLPLEHYGNSLLPPQNVVSVLNPFITVDGLPVCKHQQRFLNCIERQSRILNVRISVHSQGINAGRGGDSTPTVYYHYIPPEVYTALVKRVMDTSVPSLKEYAFRALSRHQGFFEKIEQHIKNMPNDLKEDPRHPFFSSRNLPPKDTRSDPALHRS